MRVVPLLVTTLLLAAPVFAQQASSKATATAKHKPAVHAFKVKLNPPPPAHPITAEQVHEIMQLTKANDLAHQNLLNMFAVMRPSLPPYFPQDVFVDILKKSQTVDFEPMVRTTYQDIVSTEDAAKIIAFYKTPAGQQLIRAMPAISREMQEAGVREGMKIAHQVVQEHSDEIKAAATKYRAEHSDTPTITAPN